MNIILKKNFIFCLLLFYVACLSAQSPAYLNASIPVETRVQDLLGKMTLEEKASQINNTSPAITRLQIPAYNWWNEALHGVARAGLATSFPQPIGLAATFNDKAIYKMGVIISDEARAKYNQFQREGKHGLYEGLTFYSPNINIFRDPRWGRGHETFGEDPYLTGTMGVAFVKAMQGDDPNYFKTICTAKHFAVHSGPEPTRHEFDVKPLKKDLWETYLPAFKMLAQQGKVYSFMCAYNRLYGEPCCSDPFLLTDILRKQWGFKGFVATDCGAVWDMFMYHHTAKDSVEGMAKAIRAGVDNHCMGYVGAVIPAIKQGLLKESELDTAVARLLRARFKLGMFDDASLNPYASIPYSVVNNEAHKKYALELAEQSIVLLKNKNDILPLAKEMFYGFQGKTIAVIGPNANDAEISLGNYNGEPEHVNTMLQGIKDVLGSNVLVQYAKGCYIIDTINYNREKDFKPAIAAAKDADVIIFVGGISPRLEGEALQVKIDGFDGGDKTNLDLPAVQTALLKELKKTGKPIVLVLMNGSALSINWENENIDGIIEAWYGGEAAGQAVANILFGNYNPSGRLPLTFYKSINDIPAFDDYAMKGKTYRYCEKPVLYPFGFGLSYTKFNYSNLKLSSTVLKEKIEITATVKNTGNMDGDEVVQLYIHQQGQQAIKELKGYQRVHLKKGETKQVIFILKPADLLHYSEAKDSLTVLPGKVEVQVGASSQDIRIQSSFLIKNN
ncbi:MAG: glycoside hydrolase family 3 C-terminal domain-containing protein [Chitinophagaceae bacterium]|nr:glycoside hydrolase family 3 C-terminal domain-containing protein [Chitinophagaceae bacterium]